MMVNIQNTSD